MISKNQQKLINGLKLKKNRLKSELFIAEGEKVVNELINSSLVLHSLYFTSDYQAVKDLESSKLHQIEDADLKKISNLVTPNKVLALFEIPKMEFSYTDDDLILALDDIRDPGNLGTIIRVADWFGIKNILCSSNTVDAFNPKVVMSTMGSIARVNLIYKDLLSSLDEIDLPKFGTFLEGDNIYREKLPKGAVVIIGNESNGISSEVEKLVDRKINIPQFGDVQNTESLNAAVATAITISQFKSR
jgi:RNA methyltransferase, TrmH family